MRRARAHTPTDLRRLLRTLCVRLLPSHLSVAHNDINLAGDYTLIVSAFEPHHTGGYSLKFECSTPFDLKAIPQEGAGMYTKVTRGAWDTNTAAGGPAFQKYALNPRFELALPTSGQIKCVPNALHARDSDHCCRLEFDFNYLILRKSVLQRSTSLSSTPPPLPHQHHQLV